MTRKEIRESISSTQTSCEIGFGGKETTELRLDPEKLVKFLKKVGVPKEDLNRIATE